MMKYSVVIPSYNAEQTISVCLAALTRQQFAEPYEILVVDSSQDATPEIIRQQFPQVRLTHLNERAEPGAARNIGIQQAQGELICFTDSDCIAESDWLGKMVEAHQNRDYAAVGGAILNANPDSLVGWAGYFAEFREFFPFHPQQLMQNIPTCNISYKRWVFEKYGKFCDILPESLPQKHPQQEDFVLNLKLYQQHEQILFDPAIRVAHTNVTIFKRFLAHQYRIGRSTSPLLKQFPFLPGGTLVRSRVLTCLAFPFLPALKFANTYGVAAQSQEYQRQFLRAMPLLLLGLFVWSSGFVRGAFLPLQEFSENGHNS